jgi:hypothetical protein
MAATQADVSKSSAEKLVKHSGRSRGYRFVRVEFHAYPQSDVGRVHPDDVGQQAKVIDIARPCGARLHREDMSRRGRHYAQSGMIEHPALAGVFFPGDVNARLLVKPPVGESEVIGNVPGLFQDDSVWLEYRIDVTSHAGSIVGQGQGAANDEYICDDTPAGQALAKRSERSLDLCPAKQNVIPARSRGLQVPG